MTGRPFSGPAGALLDKLLKYANVHRDNVRVDNCVSCSPPNDWLDGAPWEDEAIHCCHYKLEAALSNPNVRVVVPVGGTAIRRVLGISKRDWKSYKKPIENFHGTINQDIHKRFIVIPTIHPSALLRGNMHLFGTVVHDLRLAHEVATNGWAFEQPTLKIDPPIEWFIEWVRIVIDKSLEYGDTLPWLAVDIETPQKGVDESEASLEDPSYIITRVNFASEFDPDMGLTVPWIGPYIPHIARLLACKTLRKAFWWYKYDGPRLAKNGTPVAYPIYDMMDGFHFLHSDVPKGLGFVAPFFSKFKYPWKHLSSTAPAVYGAWDGIQTIQCTLEIEKNLIENGQWKYFERHASMLDRYALKPAEDAGLLFDKEALTTFQGELQKEVDDISTKVKQAVPEELIPLEPKNGYKRRPTLEDGTPNLDYFQVTSQEDCYKCLACGAIDVTPKHRCKERKNFAGEPLLFGQWNVTNWYTKGEFNPASPQQMLNYIRHKGHKPGIAKKTHADSADAAALERLAKKYPKDVVYSSMTTLRKLSKVKSTYVDAVMAQLDSNNRVHTVFTNNPSTWRLASELFNAQNQISAGKKEDLGLGKRYRKCVVAAPECVLLEADFSGIEAVLVGYFANSPGYIRVAKMSAHAYVATYMKSFDEEPADLAWPDDKLREYLVGVKHNPKYKLIYNRAKRAVHGSGYGMTPRGLRLTYPDEFPSEASAKEVQDTIFLQFPELRKWQHSVRTRAYEDMCLGGYEHPFRYRHWYFHVYGFEKVPRSQVDSLKAAGVVCVEIGGKWFKVSPGSDYNPPVAYMPQSTAGGILRESLLRLFVPGSPWYVGDVYYGGTPLRMPIHDSNVFEIPEKVLDEVAKKIYAAMRHPIVQMPCPEEWNMGEYLTKEQLDYLEKTDMLPAAREVVERTRYLTIDVEAEYGRNWAEMSPIAG